MKLLLDTHMLLWAAGNSDRLPAQARALIADEANSLLFSPVSLWEIVLKHMLGRPDFEADARLVRRGLLDNGYAELPVTGDHALSIDRLPPIHKDPFDRMLVAQAMAEGVGLLTADRQLEGYPGTILRV